MQSTRVLMSGSPISRTWRATQRAAAVLVLLALLSPSEALGDDLTTVDFQKATASDLELVGGATIGQVDGRRALLTEGFGFCTLDPGLGDNEAIDPGVGGNVAIDPGIGGNVALSLRYRHGSGVGFVGFCVGRTEAAPSLYALMFFDDAVGLAREADGVQEVLALAPRGLEVGRWYALGVEKAGALLRVTIDGRPALTATDPKPLTGTRLTLGSLAGRGFAFDDVAVRTGPDAAAAPIDLTDVDVAGALRIEGVGDTDQLLERIASRSALERLSHDTAIPSDRILMAAQEAELAALLAPTGITRWELKLLGRAGLKRPEHLAAAAAAPPRLYARLAAHADRYHVKRPSLERVTRWTELARGKASRLPPAVDLVPTQPEAGKVVLFSRPVTMPGDTEWARLLAERLPGFQMMEGIRTVLGPEHAIDLPKSAQSKPFVHEFEAAQAGLYRADLMLVRSGGRATLRWFVDAPRVVVNLPDSDGTLPSVAGAGHAYDPRPATTTVTGYSELVRGRELVATGAAEKPSSLCLYFWLDATKVPLDRRLRLRLEVTANDDYDADNSIEQTHRGKADPTIRGQVQVQWQAPAVVSLNSSVRFPMTGALDAVAGDFPLQAVRMLVQPAFDVRGRWITKDGKACWIEQDGVKFELSIPQSSLEASGTLSASFLTGTAVDAVKDERAIQGVITRIAPSGRALRIEWDDGLVLVPTDDGSALPGVGQDPWRFSVSVQADDGTTLTPAEVIRDDLPVGGPHPSGLYRVQPAAAGLYHLLVPSTPFTDLSAVGAVYDVSPGTGRRPYRSVEVSVEQSGGAPPIHHVVELFRLEVSDDAEPGDDDNDDPPGEFRVAVTKVLVGSPGANENEQAAIDEFYEGGVKLKTTYAAWPSWPYAWAPITRGYNTKTGKVEFVCYPRSLLGVWDVATLDQYNAMAISLVVIEDDSEDYGDYLLKHFEIAKNLVEIFDNLLDGKLKKVGEGLLKQIGYAMADYRVDTVDDTMGYLGFSSSKTSGYGLPSPDKYVKPGDYVPWHFFTLSGSSDPTDRALKGVTEGASVDRASVTIKGHGSRWAKAVLRHRRVPALYARVGAEVVGFTLGQSVDEVGDPGDVYFTLEQPHTKIAAWWDVGDAIKRTQHGDWNYKNRLGVPIDNFDYVFVDQVYTAPVGQPVTMKAGKRPWTVDVGGYDPVSCFYVEAAFYDQDPGDDQLIGRFTRTFYLEDFLKHLGTKGVYTATDDNRTLVSYYREGPYVIGDFIFKDLEGALSELRLRVHARIWEG